MDHESVLSLIEKVRSIGPGKFMGRCPSGIHVDRTPSLSIKACEDRILLYCFAGCTTEELCEALGIGVRDLFYEPKECGKPKGTRHHESAISRNSVYQTTKMLRNYANRFLDIADGYHFHADRVLTQARGVGIDDWGPE